MEIINEMKDTKAQGPDSSGVWLCNEAAIGHTRLAVIDIEGAPADGQDRGEDKYVITYNGELYNTNELRYELEYGHNFYTRSDTEVVLASYIQWGTAACPG